MATLCDSDSVNLKAGSDRPTITAGEYTELINQAEGALIADTGVNWVDLYASMDADFKQLLEAAVASKAATHLIMYDPLAYGLTVATTKVNVCLDEYDRAVKQLRESNIYKKFGGNAISG